MSSCKQFVHSVTLSMYVFCICSEICFHNYVTRCLYNGNLRRPKETFLAENVINISSSPNTNIPPTAFQTLSEAISCFSVLQVYDGKQRLWSSLPYREDNCRKARPYLISLCLSTMSWWKEEDEFGSSSAPQTLRMGPISSVSSSGKQ